MSTTYQLIGENVSWPPPGVPLVWGQAWEFGGNGPLTLGTDPDLGGAEFVFNWLSTVEQDGATYNGRQDNINQFTLDVIHKGGMGYTDDQAEQFYLEWRMSLGRGKEQLMFVSLNDRGARAQMVRLAKALPPLDLAGIRARRTWREKVSFVVDQSFWMGDVQTAEAEYPATMSNLTIDNLGDREAPVVYEIVGPITNPSIGVAGEVVTLTGTTIPAGHTWEINTDPANRYIKDTTLGQNMAAAVSAAAGRPIFWSKGVPRRTSAMAITFNGTGVGPGTRIRAVVQETHWTGVA